MTILKLKPLEWEHEHDEYEESWEAYTHLSRYLIEPFNDAFNLHVFVREDDGFRLYATGPLDDLKKIADELWLDVASKKIGFLVDGDVEVML